MNATCLAVAFALAVASAVGCYSPPTFEEPVERARGDAGRDTGAMAVPWDVGADARDATDAAAKGDADAGAEAPEEEDAGPPFPTAEYLRCNKGNPRLKWDTPAVRCRDTKLDLLCRWLLAEDGVERCLPYQRFAVGGYDSAPIKAAPLKPPCVPETVGYLAADDWTLTPSKECGECAIVSVQALGGRHAVMVAHEFGSPSGWHTASCSPTTVAFPFGKTIAVGSVLVLQTHGLALPASSFVADPV